MILMFLQLLLLSYSKEFLIYKFQRKKEKCACTIGVLRPRCQGEEHTVEPGFYGMSAETRHTLSVRIIRTVFNRSFPSCL